MGGIIIGISNGLDQDDIEEIIENIIFILLFNKHIITFVSNIKSCYIIFYYYNDKIVGEILSYIAENITDEFSYLYVDMNKY